MECEGEDVRISRDNVGNGVAWKVKKEKGLGVGMDENHGNRTWKCNERNETYNISNLSCCVKTSGVLGCVDKVIRHWM